VKTPDVLPEQVIGLPVIGIQFMTEIHPKLQFWTFSLWGQSTFPPQRTANAKKMRLRFEAITLKLLSWLEYHLSLLDSTAELRCC